MKSFYSVLVLCALLLSTQLQAGDFDWSVAFNAKAKSSGDLFLNKMTLRFGFSSGEIRRIHRLTGNPFHAYMIFRLAELSGKSLSVVLQAYQSHKDQGWGVMSKELGIRPGSPAFKQLKNSDDLFSISISGSTGKNKGAATNKKNK